MQKLKYLLIGFSFFWIFSWSVFGSLIGAKINLLISTNSNPTWFLSLQKNLLTALHSHMNNMAIILILFALTMNLIQNTISIKIIKLITLSNLFSICIFGIGLLFESFFPSSQGNISIWAAVVAAGGIVYMLTTLLWSCLFIYNYFNYGRS